MLLNSNHGGLDIIFEIFWVYLIFSAFMIFVVYVFDPELNKKRERLAEQKDYVHRMRTKWIESGEYKRYIPRVNGKATLVSFYDDILILNFEGGDRMYKIEGDELWKFKLKEVGNDEVLLFSEFVKRVESIETDGCMYEGYKCELKRISFPVIDVVNEYGWIVRLRLELRKDVSGDKVYTWKHISHYSDFWYSFAIVFCPASLTVIYFYLW